LAWNRGCATDPQVVATNVEETLDGLTHLERAVFVVVAEGAKLGEEHVVRRRVFRV
jgi:hypothetical protein